jgi:hypothetical protein
LLRSLKRVSWSQTVVPNRPPSFMCCSPSSTCPPFPCSVHLDYFPCPTPSSLLEIQSARNT